MNEDDNQRLNGLEKQITHLAVQMGKVAEATASIGNSSAKSSDTLSAATVEFAGVRLVVMGLLTALAARPDICESVGRAIAHQMEHATAGFLNTGLKDEQIQRIEDSIRELVPQQMKPFLPPL